MSDAPTAAPTAHEINAETNPTRKAVLAAMARMLAGTPTTIRPGLLSKAGLAREAQVDRNHITQGSCRDLGDRLATHAQHRITPTTALKAEQQTRIERLSTQLDQLTDAHTALRQDRDDWQASTHTLLRAIQVLRLEHTAMQADIRVLRHQLATAHQGGATGLYAVPHAP
jgi:DNA repair exonuclease SbcCD ATPase subunit